MNNLNLSVTLWPSFPHFNTFAYDKRISSIRLNSAMMNVSELDVELERIKAIYTKNPFGAPLYYDIKGRQLRITEYIPNPEYLDIRINHPIEVDTPTPVLFKAGADGALLKEVCEDGYRLKFYGGPEYMVKEGESFHIRDESLIVKGPQFVPLELEKIAKVKAAGFKNWFLSYVENQRDVDEFVELVGKDAVVNLKIENKAGLRYVATEFKKKPNLNLIAARGDLYVEVNRPHEILAAVKLIIKHDPEAIVGSRILLSVVTDLVPSCADFHEMAWLADIGYREFMLCDELCLKEPLLTRAVNAFEEFNESYTPRTVTRAPSTVSVPAYKVIDPSPVRKKSFFSLFNKK